jgi:hypothetical protein
MTSNFKITILLTSVFLSDEAFAQTISTKDLTDKWFINFSADSSKVGDTIVFRKNKDLQNYQLKPNHDLKRHTWFAYCGNKYFLDYFTPKPSNWQTIGSWNLFSIDSQTELTLLYSDKLFSFLFVSRDKHTFRFVLYDKKTTKGS